MSFRMRGTSKPCQHFCSGQQTMESWTQLWNQCSMCFQQSRADNLELNMSLKGLLACVPGLHHDQNCQLRYPQPRPLADTSRETPCSPLGEQMQWCSCHHAAPKRLGRCTRTKTRQTSSMSWWQSEEIGSEIPAVKS